MKYRVVLVLALSLLFASAAFAKRSPPEKVEPIRAGGIEYRVPHNHMGCVESWDTARDELVWRRQVYAVRYDVELERDVQDVFIVSVEMRDKKLVVKNERSSEYQLDPNSLEVKVVKGALVEGVGAG
jgi:hypothetical protein